MNKVKNKGVWLLALVMAILLAPLLHIHFEILWSRQHYQWFPLLTLFILGVFFMRWRKAEVSEDEVPKWILFSGLFFSLLLSVVAYLYFTGWVAMAAAIVGLGVLAGYLSNCRKVDGIFGLWMLLFLFVRLPQQIESRLLILFQNMSAKFASVVIDLNGIFHVVQGEFLVIDGKEIKLSEICSGYFSVISVLVMFSIFVFLRKRPTFHALFLLPAAFGVGTIVNVFRVAAVGIYYASSGENLLDSGWFLGVTVLSFGLGLLFLLSYDALIGFFMQEVDMDGRKTNGWSLAKIWNACVSFRCSSILHYFRRAKDPQRVPKKRVLMTSALSLSLVALASFEGVVLYYQWGFGDYQTYFMHDKETLAEVDENQVFFARPGWEVISVETEEREMSSIWGAFSTVWRLRYHDTMVIMALDYPFDKWHDVKRCYTKLGWQVQTEGLVDRGRYDGWGASQTELLLPTGDYGFILCSHCDHRGDVVQPKPTDHQFSMVMYYLHPKQWTAPFGVSVDKNANTFYQTQMMTTSPFPLDDPTKQEIREMYAEFREQTRALIEKKNVK